MKWLIWSNEHKMWWKANSSGYTGLRNEAGLYSLESAEGIVTDANYNQKEGDIPNETLMPDNFKEGR